MQTKHHLPPSPPGLRRAFHREVRVQPYSKGHNHEWELVAWSFQIRGHEKGWSLSEKMWLNGRGRWPGRPGGNQVGNVKSMVTKVCPTTIKKKNAMCPTQGKCGGQRKQEGSGWVPRKRIMKEKWTRREVLGEKGADCLACRGKKSFPGLWPTSISLPGMEKWKGKRGMGGRRREWRREGGVCGARWLERQVTGGFGPRLCGETS